MLKWIMAIFSQEDKGPPALFSSATNQILDVPDAKNSEPSNSIVESLTRVLKEEGYDPVEVPGGIVLPSGLIARAEFLEMHVLGEEMVRTSTRIVSVHSDQFTDGLTEFQHASGNTEQDSLENGFRTWAQTDLATLEDALAEDSKSSLVMTMDFPESESSPAIRRKIYMGPYIHHVSKSSEDGNCDPECHTFCPCCLYTKSFEAFSELLKSNRFVCIRLFASRDGDGVVSADCCVNGEDFPLGVQYLKEYVNSWPQKGFEFRKQYVVIRTAENTAS
jgi:hypothetical protein